MIYVILAFVTMFAILLIKHLNEKNDSAGLTRANERIDALEKDVQTLYGRIGILLGDNHPGGGLRSPANSERYRDKIDDVGNDPKNMFRSLLNLKQARKEIKKKFEDDCQLSLIPGPSNTYKG